MRQGSTCAPPPESLGPNVQHISVIGKEDDRPEVDQNWLVFHRDVFSPERQKVGRVEIAFWLVALKDAPGRWAVQPLAKSPLVVFFPTVVESHLGFLVQGPYRTTPSRDNIPPGEPWNQHLIKETSSLLVDALRWMRDKAMLDVSALRCLPLDRGKFPKDSRFAPMFDSVQQAFQDEELLPTFDGRHVKACQAKLARTQELRELFSPEQVALLFGSEATAWLSGDITQDKTPEIRQYLMRELDIDEITPTKLVPSLHKSFLEAQSDEWVLRLYEFLSGQEKALDRHLDAVPLIRLSDGTHVVTRENGKAKAFLPSTIATSFPTMRRAVCATPKARSFLDSLGITEPDPVDDVVWNILPKYQQGKVGGDEDAYTADIERIRAAFNTDSTAQREKLRSALRNTTFVIAVDTGDGNAYFAQPGEVYIATDRLRQLFAGVPGILIVDNKYDCLRGEEIRDLLVSCGASRYLIPEAVPAGLGYSEKAQIRKEAGLERASWEDQPEDFDLRGLTQLLEFLPTLKPEEAAVRGKALWDALTDLEARNTAAFYGSYRWGYSHETKTARFDAAFVQTLNHMAWLPNADCELVPPGLVTFDTLGWKPNPFLLAKITFKPPIIDQLAQEVGIDPAILDLLRRDPAIVAELASRLSRDREARELSKDAKPEADPRSDISDVYDDARDLYGEDIPEIHPAPPNPDRGDGEDNGAEQRNQGCSEIGAYRGNLSSGGMHGSSGGHRSPSSKDHCNNSKNHETKTQSHATGRPFISYIGAHPDDDASDPDGLVHAERMQVEERAIDLIIRLEPTLCRTADGNPGYDLYEQDSKGRQIRWVEVKSMTSSLECRPVGLTHTQFDYAREKSDAYWLYIVEHATDPTKTRVLRIRNPAGQSRTYTFDHGWREVAQTDPSAEQQLHNK